MELKLQWYKPVPLIAAHDHDPSGLTYNAELTAVPEAPGVYVFGRFHGKRFEALYVGKADNVAGRIWQQLCNNVRLMNHVRRAKSGKRVVVPAIFRPKQGQQTDACLLIIERALIRYYLSLGNDLVNIKGSKIKGHEIYSSNIPSRIIERGVFVQK